MDEGGAVVVPPEDIRSRVKLFNTENQEHERWSVDSVLASDVFSGLRPLTMEQREILDRMLLKYQLLMSSLFERFQSVMDEHIAHRIDAKDYDTIVGGAVTHEAGPSLASVVMGNKSFAFREADYPDLADIHSRIGSLRQEMALSVLHYVDALNQ